MQNERHVRLFRNGRNQALRIPREFELPGDEAILRKEGGRLLIEPVTRRRNQQELLATLQPLNEPLPIGDRQYSGVRTSIGAGDRELAEPIDGRLSTVPIATLRANHAPSRRQEIPAASVSDFSREALFHTHPKHRG